MPDPSASSLPPYGQVTSAAAALTLLREGQSGWLEPLAAGPLPLAALARELQEPLYRVRRWALRLAEQGILEVAWVEKRSGRPIRHYRLAHTDFFIPLELVPVEDLLDLTETAANERINRNLAYELAHVQGVGGYHVHLEAGNSGVLMAHAPFRLWHPTVHSDTVLHLRWLTLHLTHGEAQALQDELAEVLGRYLGRSGPQEYLVALKMVSARD